MQSRVWRRCRGGEAAPGRYRGSMSTIVQMVSDLPTGKSGDAPRFFI